MIHFSQLLNNILSNKPDFIVRGFSHILFPISFLFKIFEFNFRVLISQNKLECLNFRRLKFCDYCSSELFSHINLNFLESLDATNERVLNDRDLHNNERVKLNTNDMYQRDVIISYFLMHEKLFARIKCDSIIS